MGHKNVYRVPNARHKSMPARTFRRGQIADPEENSRQENQACPCGSGKTFGACCYRPYHTRYNLSRVLEQLKDKKVRLMHMAYGEFVRRYADGAEFQEIADSLAMRLKMSPLSQVIEDVANDEQGLPNDNDPIPSAYFAETLLVDRVLLGQEVPWFQGYFQTHLRKRTSLEAECIASYGQSQVELFEVVEVRRGEEVRAGKSSSIGGGVAWVKLRNLFTGEEIELKDPRFAIRLKIWDILIGRLYKIDGFNLLSTAVSIITPHQRPVLSRLFLYLWWAWEQRMNGYDVKRLEEEYPTLRSDFQQYETSLDLKVLCNPHLRAFLKADAPAACEVCDLLQKFSEVGGPVILAPDGYPAVPCEAYAVLLPGHGHEVRKLLVHHPECFAPDSPDDGDLANFEMVFYSPRVKPATTDHEGPLFRDLLAMPLPQFVEALLFASRHLVVVSSTHKHRSVSGFEKDLSSQQHGETPPICGSVVEEGPRLRLFAMSEESMIELKLILKRILGDVLQRIEESGVKSPKQRLEELPPLMNPGETASNTAQERQYLGMKAPAGITASPETPEEEEDDFASNFEQRFLKRQLVKWLDDPVPLLQGKTPRQAGNIPSLRPILLDLLKDCEHDMDSRGFYNPEKSLMRELHIADI